MGVSSMVVPLVMISESPSVRMSCASIRRCGSPPPVTRTSSARWTPTPTRKNGGIVRSAPSRGSTPETTARKYVRYIPSIMKSPCAELTTRMTPKIRARPMLMSAKTPPTSRPVTTYCARSLTDMTPLLGAVPDGFLGGVLHRHDGERLSVLPLHDDGRGAHAAAALVVLDPPRRQRARRPPRFEVELRHGVADRLRVGGLRHLRRLLDDPDVGVGHERVLRHERLAGALREALDQLLLALERVGGGHGHDVVEQLLAHRLDVLRRHQPGAHPLDRHVQAELLDLLEHLDRVREVGGAVEDDVRLGRAHLLDDGRRIGERRRPDLVHDDLDPFGLEELLAQRLEEKDGGGGVAADDRRLPER